MSITEYVITPLRGRWRCEHRDVMGPRCPKRAANAVQMIVGGVKRLPRKYYCASHTEARTKGADLL